MTAYRCPGCDYVYDEARSARRVSGGHGMERHPDDWCCPDCAVREKVDFEEIGALK